MFLNLDDFSQSLNLVLKQKSKEIALGADNDLDGLFSAIKLDLGIYDLYETEVETFFREELHWEIPIYDEFDVMIFLDLAYDNTPNYRKVASQGNKVYSIDHHIMKETGFPQKVSVYNPCSKGQCYQPTTHLVHKILSKLGKDVNNPLDEYFNILGVLADAGINFKVTDDRIEYSYDPTLKPIFEKAQNDYNYLFDVHTFDEFRFPHYKKTIEALNLEAADLGWKELYYRFINETTDQSAAQRIVQKIEQKYEGKFEELLQQIPKHPSEITHSGIWLINNKTPLNNGTIGRIIAEMYNQSVICFSCMKFCRVSARAPAESNVNFIPLFKGFGGGHPKACGAFLKPNRFQNFFQAIKNF